jgi:uncharacterized SAM-binding protein YcdF (DUF218 family)
MLFALSKLAWYVIAPGNFCILLLIAGLVWRYASKRRHGMLLIIAGTLGLAGIAVLPVANWTLVPLENRFPQPSLPNHVDGIVVLGGSVNQFITASRGQPAVATAADRLFAATELARRYPDAKVIVSGGEASIVPTHLVEAPIMRDVLVRQGVDPKRIVIEDKSRNTFENAVESYRVAEPKPGQTWILVTSAWHMPRAVGCFRTAGWSVLPYPVDYRTTGVRGKLASLQLTMELDRLDLAVREWIGLIVYAAEGRIDNFLPGPG